MMEQEVLATSTENLSKREVGRAFVRPHQSEVIGVLHGWDRLRLQGTLRSLYYLAVMEQHLRKAGLPERIYPPLVHHAVMHMEPMCRAVGSKKRQH